MIEKGINYFQNFEIDDAFECLKKMFSNSIKITINKYILIKKCLYYFMRNYFYQFNDKNNRQLSLVIFKINVKIIYLYKLMKIPTFIFLTGLIYFIRFQNVFLHC